MNEIIHVIVIEPLNPDSRCANWVFDAKAVGSSIQIVGSCLYAHAQHQKTIDPRGRSGRDENSDTNA
jgi:hypothetical protein